MDDESFFEFLGNTLNIPADDPVVGHIVTNIMHLTKIEEVTFENFQSLFNHAGVNNEEDLKKKINNLRNETEQDHHFKSMYKGIFKKPILYI